MYSTCIFCHSDLGQNESIEHFPVGRRLAFDATRGRLWVVCRKCERWNLTPMDARWEAIEECERLFRDTKLRVSTDNIGLARLPEGLEIVRIGQPQRPEMAGWRYGDQFGRRRRRYYTLVGAGVAAAAGLVVLGPVTGVLAGGSISIWNLLSLGHSAYAQRRVRARLSLPGVETTAEIRLKQLKGVALVANEAGWGLSVPYQASTQLQELVVLTGEDAIRAAGKLLPSFNESGAGRAGVRRAVELIEETGSPDALFRRYALRLTSLGKTLGNLPVEARLALEMATHEESERRALEGELAVLEAAWKEAEEIAAIADDLLVPDDAKRRLTALKRGDDTR